METLDKGLERGGYGYFEFRVYTTKDFKKTHAIQKATKGEKILNV